MQYTEIDYLYHLTHVNNLQSILDWGILSRNHVEAHDLAFSDISMPEVQSVRNELDVYGKALHDYACLYFWPRNAMLYRRYDSQASIIILGVDPVVLTQPTTVFTDGNAASQHHTSYLNDITKLDTLPWHIIKARHWSKYKYGKRMSCAEVLVYPKVDPAHILGVLCYSQKQVDQCEDIAGPYATQVNVRRDLYF